MPITEAGTQREIAAFLPYALREAIRAYHLQLDNALLDSPENFDANLEGCRKAVADIRTLVRLAGAIEGPEGGALQDAIYAARKAIEQAKNRE